MAAAPAFLTKVDQPMRGLLGTAIMVAMGVVIYVVFMYLWKPWDGSLLGVTWATFPLWGVWSFFWFAIMAFHFGNWPFHKMSQPWQGLASMAVAMVLQTITFWILFYGLMQGDIKWVNTFFPLGLLCYFWSLAAGPLAGSPILTGYEGKQPVAGIMGTITCLGLAILCWWVLPESFMGIPYAESPTVLIGFPFVWFLVLCATFILFEFWPIGTLKQPTQVVVHVGILVTATAFIMMVLAHFDLNFFGPRFVESADFLLIWIQFMIFLGSTFQMWPLHTLSQPLKGIVWCVITGVIALAIYHFIIGGGVWAWNDIAEAGPARWHESYGVLNWNLAIFIAWVGWTFCSGILFAPPPGTKA